MDAVSNEVSLSPTSASPTLDQQAGPIRETLPIFPVKHPLIGKRTLILCAILILASIIIGLFLRSQQKALDDIYRPAALSPTLLPSQSLPSPTQGSTDRTSKTFKWIDATSSFSVEFPRDWFKSITPTPGKLKGPEYQIRSRCDTPDIKICIEEIISSKILDNSKHLSLADIAVKEISWTEVDPGSITHMTFSDGTPYILVENISAMDAIRQIYLKKNGESTVKIEFTGGKEDLNQFISTFKFLDQEETVSWKTYINTQYGYSIKYPSAVTVEDPNDPTSESYIRFIVDKEQLLIKHLDNPQKQNAKDFYNNLMTKSISEAKKNGWPAPPAPLETQEASIANIPIFQVTSSAGDGNTLHTYIAKDTSVIDISLYKEDSRNSNINNIHAKLFNQILSTFKFIDVKVN